MGYQISFPAELQRVEYVKLYFYLETRTYFDLPSLGLLQLRRELLQALKTFPGQDRDYLVGELRPLLQPDLPSDPVLLRQIQKPPPAVVISPDILQYGLFEPGQRIVLPVLFIGPGIIAIDPFVCLLQHLGTRGLYHGFGQFSLEGVESEDGSGTRSMLWFGGKRPAQFAPPVSDLSWWLERQTCTGDLVQIEMITPLRLLHQGKPLFKAEFAKIFPFLLRRITALLAAHARVELNSDPARLISLASQVSCFENHLCWQDWRTLKKDKGAQNLGGLVGSFKITGTGVSELLWVLQLGSLLNFGKGAAYGAGQYRLICS